MKWWYLLFSIPIFFAYQGYKIMNAKSENEKFYRYDGLFKLYGMMYKVPWRWLKAIAKQESDLGEDRTVKNGEVSYDGLSYGIMQIAEGVGSAMEIEIKGHGGKERLNDPAYSIKQAARLVQYLRTKYSEPYKVFLAYNQGEKNTDRGKNYSEQYPEKIMKWLLWIETKEKEFEL